MSKDITKYPRKLKKSFLKFSAVKFLNLSLVIYLFSIFFSIPVFGQFEEQSNSTDVSTIPNPLTIPLLQNVELNPPSDSSKNIAELELRSWQLKWGLMNASNQRNRKTAQVSILPYVGTNSEASSRVTNIVSLNLLMGVNGGVNGVEVGGLVNTVEQDMKGFQMAGVGNQVGHNVVGTQVGGLFNSNQGSTRGVQAAGLINYSKNGDAVQAAGLMNFVADGFEGVQASGLFNKAGKNSNVVQAAGLFNLNEGASKLQIGGLLNIAKAGKFGQVSGLMNVAGENSNVIQAAGLFNLNKGKSKFQVGGLFNKAKVVNIAQVSGFVNIAENVRGLQIGFINVSDTVSGVPIGLINIVKKGYNKLSLYSSEVLHANVEMKLGAKIFYNIFHVGARFPQVGNFIWGLGYGIGTVHEITPKVYLNIEATAIHVSENEAWTNELNTIGQLKVILHKKIGEGKTGFFFGPTLNIMLSQMRNLEGDLVGSSVAPYALINRNLNKNTNLKGWIGANVGFRF